MKIYRASCEGRGRGRFSLDHGNRISCFDSGSPIRGELLFCRARRKVFESRTKEERERGPREKQAPARGGFPFRLFEFVERVRFCLFFGNRGGRNLCLHTYVCVRPGGRYCPCALISSLMLHTHGAFPLVKTLRVLRK